MATASRTLSAPLTCPMADLFPNSLACRMHFVFGDQTLTHSEDIFVGQLDKEGKIDRLKTFSRSFSVATITVDTAHHVILVEKKGPMSSPQFGERWVSYVTEKITEVLGTVTSKVVNAGPRSREIQRCVLKMPRPPGSSLSCLLSSDCQSLLLLSSDAQEVRQAELFAKAQLRQSAAPPSTASAATQNPTDHHPVTWFKDRTSLTRPCLNGTDPPQAAAAARAKTAPRLPSSLHHDVDQDWESLTTDCEVDATDQLCERSPATNTPKETDQKQTSSSQPPTGEDDMVRNPHHSGLGSDADLQEADVIESYSQEADVIESYSQEAGFIESYSQEAGFIESYSQEAGFIESYSLEADVIESYSLEADAIEFCSQEADVVESYSQKADVIESYSLEADAIEFCSEEADVFESYSQEADVFESYSQEADVIESCSQEADVIEESEVTIMPAIPPPAPRLPSPLKTHSGRRSEFVTPSGLRVSVYRADLTQLRVDAVVNATDGKLGTAVGVARALVKAAGAAMTDQVQDYVRQNGPLREKQVLCTTAGQLPCGQVLHTLGPRWDTYQDKALCGQRLADTVLQCLKKAGEKGLTSLAVPCISAGSFGVPPSVCGEQLLRAVKTFEEQRAASSSSLQHLHLVDLQQHLIHTLQQVFTQRWSQELSPLGVASPSGQSAQVLSVYTARETDQKQTPASQLPTEKDYMVRSPHHFSLDFDDDPQEADMCGEGEAIVMPAVPPTTPRLPSPLKTHSGRRSEFVTPSGLRVSVYRADLTQLRVDAVVNATDGKLGTAVGVARALVKAAGAAMTDQVQDYVRQNGPLRERQLLCTTAGQLPCGQVLHTLGPRWDTYQDKALCGQRLADTVLQCLRKAGEKGLTSLAVPCISAGGFGVPPSVCAGQYLQAVKTFEEKHAAHSSLRHLHLVDRQQDLVNTLQQVFTDTWTLAMAGLSNTGLLTQKSRTRPMKPTPLPRTPRPAIPPSPLGSATLATPAANLAALPRLPVARRDFTTPGGTKVSVQVADITGLAVGAVVAATSTSLYQGTGVALAIANAGGAALKAEVASYISSHGRVKVGQVVSVSGGRLPCQTVLLAAGPRWPDYQDKARCQRHLARTVCKCLETAEAQQLTSVAMPLISSGNFGVPADVCAESYMSGMEQWEQRSDRHCCLKHVHFVDVKENKIRFLQGFFAKRWDSDSRHNP